MAQVPSAVAQAAGAFGLDAGSLRALGGNSGSAWGAGNRVLRVGRPAVIDAELAASSAAAAVLPVPAVLDRAEVGDVSAALLEMLPGRPAADFARDSPGRARVAGQACGAVHALLAGVRAPAGLRTVPGPGIAAPAGQARVVHLDLHPFNILTGAGGEVTGVLDWANAAAGDPDLDRARTWAILTLYPAARARRGGPGWAALLDGWAESAALHDVPPSTVPGRVRSCCATSPGAIQLMSSNTLPPRWKMRERMDLASGVDGVPGNDHAECRWRGER